jgi:hypothetical protein
VREQRFVDLTVLHESRPVTPAELADGAVAQWERALRLAHQNATYNDNAARAHLEQLRRDTDARAHSVELREKEWDMAARVRERALADTRDQVRLLEAFVGPAVEEYPSVAAHDAGRRG